MKSQKTPSYYLITRNSDTTEGRGSTLRTNVAFSSEEEALKFVQSKYYASRWGIMGTTGSKYDIEPIYDSDLTIYQSLEDYVENVANKKTTKNINQMLKNNTFSSHQLEAIENFIRKTGQ